MLRCRTSWRPGPRPPERPYAMDASPHKLVGSKPQLAPQGAPSAASAGTRRLGRLIWLG